MCAILITMKRPIRRMQITVYESYTLSFKEKAVYHAILERTILNNKRCAELSLSYLEKITRISKSSVDYQLKKLERRRLIEIDHTKKTNIICIITTYKELYK